MGTGDRLKLYPGGSRNTPSCFMFLKSEISTSLVGYLACMQTLPSHLISKENILARKQFLSCTKLTIVFHQVCKSIDGIAVCCCLAHFQVVGLSTGT